MEIATNIANAYVCAFVEHFCPIADNRVRNSWAYRGVVDSGSRAIYCHSYLYLRLCSLQQELIGLRKGLLVNDHDPDQCSS